MRSTVHADIFNGPRSEGNWNLCAHSKQTDFAPDKFYCKISSALLISTNFTIEWTSLQDPFHKINCICTVYFVMIEYKHAYVRFMIRDL